MAEVFLILGSNLDNKQIYIESAMYLINFFIGNIIKKSSYYKSEAWGMENAPDFLNIVILIKTFLSPIKIINKILYIEYFIGRKKKLYKKYENRIIDIDILFYDNIIFKNKRLIIPHKLLHIRKFVLLPLYEISPNKKHPIFNKLLYDYLIYCDNTLSVKKIK